MTKECEEKLRKKFEEVLKQREENACYISEEEIIEILIKLTNQITESKEKGENGIVISTNWKTHILTIESFPERKIVANENEKVRCKKSTLENVQDFLDTFSDITIKNSSDMNRYEIYMKYGTLLL